MRKIERILTSGAVITGLLFGGAGCASTTNTRSQSPNEVLPTSSAGEKPAIQSTPPPDVSAEIAPTVTAESYLRILSYGNYVWNVYAGIPQVNGQELILPGSTDIQSESVFYDGILKGELSSLQLPQGESSNSSIGFERWWNSSKGNCHYGVLLKTNGNLAIFSPQIGANKDCVGNLLVQDYLPIPNWGVISGGEVISFTLSWSPNGILLKVSGNGKEGQVSYSGPATPDVPLGIRLYTQENNEYRVKNLVNHRCSNN